MLISGLCTQGLVWLDGKICMQIIQNDGMGMACHTMGDKVRVIRRQVWMVVAKGIFAVFRPSPCTGQDTGQR